MATSDPQNWHFIPGDLTDAWTRNPEGSEKLKGFRLLWDVAHCWMPCQVLPCKGTTHRNWAFRLLLSLDNVLDSLRWRFQLHEAPNYGRWFPRQGLVEKSGHWKTEDVRYSGNRWARVCGQQGKKGADEWMNRSTMHLRSSIPPCLDPLDKPTHL